MPFNATPKTRQPLKPFWSPERAQAEAFAEIDRQAARALMGLNWVPEGPWDGLADSMRAAKEYAERGR